MKRILTIEDISCLGQCSLTVALPIISAMQIETVILPSAVLSTHTGGFKNFTFHDLTEDLPKIATHWKQEKITFDGIYTGYIGSAKQIDYIIDIINNFKKEDDIYLCDPAMADNGKLYYGFDESFVDKMCELVKIADYIVPNITEACYLLHREMIYEYDQNLLEQIMLELSMLGPKYVIITGVRLEENKIGIAVYDKVNKTYNYYFNELINQNFHGTGDVWASCYFGALINGKNAFDAGRIAVLFTLQAIKETVKENDNHWYGVHFEKALPMLIDILKK